jgi:phage shock protein E
MYRKGREMNKKTIMIITVTAALTLLLCSCGDGGTTTSSTSTTQKTSTITRTYPTEPLILYENAPATYQELPTITPAELKAMIDNNENIVIVDVGLESMYNSGHISGAINLAWSYKGFLTDPDLPRSVLVVFYCVCENEEDSGLMGLSAVTKYGYRNIKLLKGGTPAWEHAGYELVPS